MCWHKFGKWSKPFDSEMEKGFGHFGETTTIKVVLQQCTCTKCNLVKTRVIREGQLKNKRAN